MEVNGLLGGIAAAARRNAETNPDDYRDRSGLLYCGNCHTKKETVITWPGTDKPVTVACMCRCAEDRYRGRYSRRKAEERREAAKRENLSDMDSENAQSMTMEADDGHNEFMSELCRVYVGNWKSTFGTGKDSLVLWGSTGTGKTFYATAIGNELIKTGVAVGRTTASQIVEAMQGMYDSDKTAYISSLNQFQLLILDDIGAERDTAFAREVMFSLIDTRLKRKLPIIATTNLSIDQMKDPRDRTGNTDMGYKRIFDRLLGASAPIQLSGVSRREKSGEEARNALKRNIIESRRREKEA